MKSPLRAASVICVAAAAAVLAQAPDTGPTVRVTVDLVQVDAVVTDAAGRHVSDLKAEDFQILEDGKPQKITALSYVRASGAATAPRPVNRTPGPARFFIPPEPPKREGIHRTIVLMADDLGIGGENAGGVRSAMKSFVEREMQPGDLVSIMKTSGGMAVAEELTVDKRHLEDSIDHLHYAAGRTGLYWYTPVHNIDAASAFENAASERVNAARAPVLAAGTATALAYAIQGLRDIPGRKAIVLFSEGIPASVGAIAELANRASVVIYTIDPRGLASFYLTAADNCACSGAEVHRQEAKREAVYRGSQESLDVLARATGGLFLHDNNDLDGLLKTAMDDVGSYYLIAYQPHREDFDEDGGKPRYHKIEVKVLRPGLKVRSRQGFLGVRDSPPAEEALRAEAFQDPLFSPFQATGVPVQLSAYYSAQANAKNARRQIVLRAMMAIDARALGFPEAPGGAKELALDVKAGAWNENGKAAGESSKTFDAALRPDEVNDMINSGLLYGFDVALPRPGAYQLRIAVKDRNSGKTGSAYQFIDIPDFNRAPLVLSSMTLRDPDPVEYRDLIRAGVFGAGSAVTRAFAPGSTLRYDCLVFGELVDHPRSRPALRMQVRIFRGPNQIFLSPAIPVPEEKQPDIHASGKIKLPRAMPAGDYLVQLSVTEADGKAAHTAEQWTDFTLVQPGAAR